MSAELIGVLGIVVFIVLILCRVWVGAALAIVGFAGIWLISGLPQALATLGTAPFSNIDNYTITTIPMFTLMGMVIAETNIGSALYDAAYHFIGRFRGGLASATVVAGGLMGAITGSENVSTVIMSKIAFPPMKKLGYSDELASGSVAAGSPLAIIIPPSMPMIMYGILTEQSIGKLFVSGIIPGVLMVVAFVVAIWLLCVVKPAHGPKGPKFAAKECMHSLVGVLPTVILFLLVLGGIYAGICTTTEAGAIGALGAIIIAAVTGQLNKEKIGRILKGTVLTTAFVLFLLVGTYVFIQFVAISKLPFLITNFITGLHVSKYVVLLLVALMYIVLGMCLPAMTMMVLTIPLLYPAMMALGFHPIWFGLFVVLMQALGGITPPVGMVVYILGGTTKVPITRIFKGAMPFVVAELIVILLVCIFPALATVLPGLMS